MNGDNAQRRIAIVFHRSDVVGGASIYALDLGEALAERGHTVRFMVPEAGAYTTLIEKRGLDWVGIEGMGRSLAPHRLVRGFRALRSAMEAFQPDLIAAQASTAGALCRLLHRSVDAPIVYTPHSWSFAPGAPRHEAFVGLVVERLLRRRSAAVIAVSDFERRVGLRYGAVSADQVHVIHNGVHELSNEVKPGPPVVAPANGRLRVISVARFESQKDHRTLLEALRACDHDHIELTLVGDGPLMAETQELAESLGLNESIRWLGAIDNVADWLASADLFVLATNWESLPLSILEAMRASLPVIATDVGGVNEVVVEGETGRLVGRGSVTDLAKALTGLTSSESLRLSMGAAGRQRYLGAFTFEHMLKPTLQLYESVTRSDSSKMSRER